MMTVYSYERGTFLISLARNQEGMWHANLKRGPKVYTLLMPEA